MKKVCLLAAAVWTLVMGILPGVMKKRVPVVEYVHPTADVLKQPVQCSGTVFAEHQTEIYLPTAVIAGQVLAEVGQPVSEGDLLASIDIEATESALKSGVRTSAQDESMGYAAALLSSGVVTQEQLAPLLKQLQEDQKDFSVHRENVIQSQIYAPQNGVVTAVSLQENVLTQSDKAAITVADLQSCKVLCSIPQRELDRVAVGDPVRIKAPGTGGREYRGVVQKIHPTARKQYRKMAQETVVDVEIRIEDGDEFLKPGFAVTAKIFPQDLTTALTVPYEAIGQDASNQEYLYVLKDGLAIRKNITTGQELLERVEVASGLQAEDLVILLSEVSQEPVVPVRLGEEGRHE